MLPIYPAPLGWITSFQKSVDYGTERFTDRGRTMIGREIGGLWSSAHESFDGPYYPKWQIWLRPSVVGFIRDGVGVGGFLNASRSGAEYTDTTELGGGCLSIVEITLGPKFGWMINSSLSYQRYMRHMDLSWVRVGGGPITNDYQSNVIRLSVSLPVVFHVSEHVGIGLGPDVWFDLDLKREVVRKGSPYQSGGSNGGASTLQVGLSSWIGYSF